MNFSISKNFSMNFSISQTKTAKKFISKKKQKKIFTRRKIYQIFCKIFCKIPTNNKKKPNKPFENQKIPKF